MSVQVRIAVAKNDERVDGPDDAAVVFTVPVALAAAAAADPAVAFMRGELKATGDTGALLDAIANGEAAAALARLTA